MKRGKWQDYRDQRSNQSPAVRAGSRESGNGGGGEFDGKRYRKVFIKPTGLSAVRKERDNCLLSNFTPLEPRLSIFTIRAQYVCSFVFLHMGGPKLGIALGLEDLTSFVVPDFDINELVLGFDFCYTKVRVPVRVCVFAALSSSLEKWYCVSQLDHHQQPVLLAEMS